MREGSGSIERKGEVKSVGDLVADICEAGTSMWGRLWRRTGGWRFFMCFLFVFTIRWRLRRDILGEVFIRIGLVSISFY